MNVIKYMSAVLLALLVIGCSKEAPVAEVPATPMVTEVAPVVAEPVAEVAPVAEPVAEVAPVAAESDTAGGGGYVPTADELVPGITQ